jgi:hypothetical protein
LNTRKHAIFLNSLAWTESLRTVAEQRRHVLAEYKDIDGGDLAFLKVPRYDLDSPCGYAASASQS